MYLVMSYYHYSNSSFVHLHTVTEFEDKAEDMLERLNKKFVDDQKVDSDALLRRAHIIKVDNEYFREPGTMCFATRF